MYKRQIFGAENVVEHHSNYDFRDLDDEDKAKQRLAIQNWDAPIVVTTNVQLFESLFSKKPGKSRKVHHMAPVSYTHLPYGARLSIHA